MCNQWVIAELFWLMFALSAGAAGADLVRTNASLLHWLALIDTDKPYLVFDGQANEVRLQHGRAILRQCPVRSYNADESLGVRAALVHCLRRYRPIPNEAMLSTSPFDWEDNLARRAPPDVALYFGNGLLVYSDKVWQSTAGPTLRLESRDLRALANTCSTGTALVVLPKRWNVEP